MWVIWWDLWHAVCAHVHPTDLDLGTQNKEVGNMIVQCIQCGGPIALDPKETRIPILCATCQRTTVQQKREKLTLTVMGTTRYPRRTGARHGSSGTAGSKDNDWLWG